MPLPTEKKLVELRNELAVRCGFGSQSNNFNRALLDSTLAESQEFLYEHYDWPYLREVWDFTIASGQNVVDWPTSVSGTMPNPERIMRLQVLIGGTTDWRPIDPGIGLAEDRISKTGYPEKYEIGAQLQVWPTTDRIYTLRIEATRFLSDFAEDDDRCSLPSRIVFLRALLFGKFHYRQPDAQTLMGEYQRMMMKIKGRAHNGRRYLPGRSGGTVGVGDAKPVIVPFNYSDPGYL